MHVESINVVSEHPFIFPLLPLSANGRLGVVYIAPIEKLAIGGEVQLSLGSSDSPVPPTGQSSDAMSSSHCEGNNPTVSEE